MRRPGASIPCHPRRRHHHQSPWQFGVSVSSISMYDIQRFSLCFSCRIPSHSASSAPSASSWSPPGPVRMQTHQRSCPAQHLAAARHPPWRARTQPFFGPTEHTETDASEMPTGLFTIGYWLLAIHHWPITIRTRAHAHTRTRTSSSWR